MSGENSRTTLHFEFAIASIVIFFSKKRIKGSLTHCPVPLQIGTLWINRYFRILQDLHMGEKKANI